MPTLTNSCGGPLGIVFLRASPSTGAKCVSARSIAFSSSSSQGRTASALRRSSGAEPSLSAIVALCAAIESNVTPNFVLTSLMMRSASAFSASDATRTLSFSILMTLASRAMSARTARLPAIRCSASTPPSRRCPDGAGLVPSLPRTAERERTPQRSRSTSVPIEPSSASVAPSVSTKKPTRGRASAWS